MTTVSVICAWCMELIRNPRDEDYDVIGGEPVCPSCAPLARREAPKVSARRKRRKRRK